MKILKKSLTLTDFVVQTNVRMGANKCIGILTSGGDAPGMNAAIRAVTRSAIFNGFSVKGIMRGYKGLVFNEIVEFKSQSVSNIIQLGGTILKTARCKEFMTPEGRKQAYDNMVAAGIADEMLIQISYAIGVAQPVGVYVDTRGTAKIGLSDAAIAKKVSEIFDLRPKAIEQRLKLREPIYLETASYGHMGRTPRVVKKTFTSNYWPTVEKEVELFTWEKLDYVDRIRAAFNLRP